MIFEVVNNPKNTLKTHPNKSEKTTASYRGNTEVSVDFSAEGISPDGAVVLLEKLERKHKLIARISEHLPDRRDSAKVTHSVEKLLRQRGFLLMQGYQDCNDAGHLRNDPLFEDILGGPMASQPTLSRFENSVDKQPLFDLCYGWLDRYVDSLAGRNQIIIDIDATDDPTHGNQQLSMFHEFYGQLIYSELFFHDGDTGQIIVPVLRPGNSHSGRWHVGILRRVVHEFAAAAVYRENRTCRQGTEPALYCK
ncbi:MAG: transposase [Balneolaceae bacterium]|nr:transposase [Balneolaceae bacterium]